MPVAITAPSPGAQRKNDVAPHSLEQIEYFLTWIRTRQPASPTDRRRVIAYLDWLAEDLVGQHDERAASLKHQLRRVVDAWRSHEYRNELT